MIPPSAGDEMVLEVRPGASIESNTVLVSSVLKQTHGGESDHALVVPEQLLDQSRRTRAILTVVMAP